MHAFGPGYETTLVQTADGAEITGILKDDGATSLVLAQANGGEQILLRKDVIGVRRLATSLMPSFAEALSPADVANVLAWLKSSLGSAGATSNYFELRIYDVAARKLGAVLERFRDTVEPVRKRHGIDTVGYWTATNTNGEKFIYLLKARSKDELQKLEKQFGEDPDFKAGYAASNVRYGGKRWTRS